MSTTVLTLRDIFRARKRIAGVARHTPLNHSQQLNEQVGVCAYLKLNCLQEVGCFKIHGAASKMLRASAEQKHCGVVTYSMGNHRLAVARVAKQVGAKAIVCPSKRIPLERIRALEALNADVIVHGQSQAFVDNLILVSEEQIAEVSLFAFEKHRLVMEGVGAVGIAALLFNHVPDIGRNAVAVVSSGNASISQFCQIAQRGSFVTTG